MTRKDYLNKNCTDIIEKLSFYWNFGGYDNIIYDSKIYIIYIDIWYSAIN